MNSRTKPLELLAPAKTAAIGREAVLHGADAVYIGGPAFGARHAAGNDIGDIARLVEFAHRFHVRIYVTLNTILHDDELEPARALVRQCWDAGVDALIVQDMGLLELDLPPIDLHASTQCDIRTPEKARFLADAGFSQLVLARELTLEEIARVRTAVPEDVVIEHFVHGALCVAYSGQCYISHAQTGRSANRGDCSQACRLPYTLEDDRGRVVAFEKHLLSLKDNNQSAHLAALVDAGVASFKIEGRYKEAAYVKNITGHYRRLIDALLEGRPDLQRASSGRTTLFFTPDPDKTFHRGATDYFSRGRQADIGAFDAPAFVGLPLGTVTRVGPDWIEIATREDLGNGDGLNWLHKRRTVGAQANRVERLTPSDGAADPLWRVWPNEPLSALPGLQPGLPVNRNRDHAWEQALLRGSAERRIAIRGEFTETPTGYRLRLTDADGIAAEAAADCPHEDARVPGHAAEALRGHLDRQVAALEAHLGTKLLARSTRRLALTSAGTLYLEKCRVILNLVEAAETDRDVRAPPPEHDGHVEAAPHGDVGAQALLGRGSDVEHAAGRHLVVPHAPAGELRQFEEGRAGIDQRVDPLARQQLAAGDVLRARLPVAAQGDAFDLRAQVGDERRHALEVRAKLRRARVELAAQDGH